MSASTIRAWIWVHKWTSLVCTLFLLLLCLTGLPLIFRHELDHALGHMVSPPERAGAVGRADLDAILSSARARRPLDVVQFVSRDPDEPDAWFVGMAESASAEGSSAFFTFDARSGELLSAYPLEEGVMSVLVHLHTDLFAGLPGTLFLGAMGVLLLASLISGAVVYGPFMRKLRFGSVRFERAPRTRFLDLHNLLGIATLVWLFSVGATGVISTLARPIMATWQSRELASLTARHGAEAIVTAGSAARALATAQRAAQGYELAFMAFPGNAYASPRHYVAFMRGATPLTSRLYTPVVIDAATGAFVAKRELPWYAAMLFVSLPLHFGDYGGLPLKILWALFDVAAIVVLASGLYLWLKKSAAPAREPRLDALSFEGAP